MKKEKTLITVGITIMTIIFVVICGLIIQNRKTKENTEPTSGGTTSVSTSTEALTSTTKALTSTEALSSTETLTSTEILTSTEDTITTSTTTIVETTAPATVIETTVAPTTVIETTTIASATVIETTPIETTVAPATTIETTLTSTETSPVENYVVFKPATHYIHKNTCHWAAQDEVIRIENTEGIECRLCTECNPSMEIVNPYVEPVQSSLTYVKNFSRGTYYAYGEQKTGGSGRSLIDCSCGDGTVKGSVASSYLYNNYGYNRNGRTMVYLEVSGYSSMNGYYYLDDSDAGNPNVIDFYYTYGSSCPFQGQGVVSVDCYIVN